MTGEFPSKSPHKRPVTRKMFPFDDVIMRDPSHPSPSVNVFFLTTLDAASISGYPSTRVVWNSSCEQLSLKIGYVIRFARKIHSLFYSYLNIRAMVTFIMIWSIFYCITEITTPIWWFHLDFCIYIWSAPSHYLNQCWNIVNSKLRNKLVLNIKRNSYIFIQENAFKTSSPKWRPFFSWPPIC